MLSKTFHNLPVERRQTVLQVCMAEFAEHGFDGASTNRMVRQLGVAKGTLFKYAPSKLELFLHIYEEVINELAQVQDDPAIYRSSDLFVRVEELFDAALAYAAEHPLHYRFALQASADEGSSAFPAMERRRREISGRHLRAIFEGVDWGLYRLPREQVVEVFTWIMSGTRAAAITALGPHFNMANYTTLIRRQIALMRLLLRGGIYVDEEPS